MAARSRCGVMRFTGRIHTWNEERGFGFIRPTDGGQDIFVHVSSLPKPVPGPDEILSFAVALNQEGKKKAVDVRLQRVEQQGLADDRMRTARRAAPEGRRYEPRRRARWPGALVTLVLLASVGAYVYQRAPWNLLRAIEADTRPVAVPEPASVSSSRYRCDGRTLCSQMTSCEEASFFLRNCPGVKMDGNNDGIPCERQWCQ